MYRIKISIHLYQLNVRFRPRYNGKKSEKEDNIVVLSCNQTVIARESYGYSFDVI